MIFNHVLISVSLQIRALGGLNNMSADTSLLWRAVTLRTLREDIFVTL